MYLTSDSPGPDDSVLQEQMERLPEGSVLEVCFDWTDVRYFRKERIGWTKVGEAEDPFFIEIFINGRAPVVRSSEGELPFLKSKSGSSPSLS